MNTRAGHAILPPCFDPTSEAAPIPTTATTTSKIAISLGRRRFTGHLPSRRPLALAGAIGYENRPPLPSEVMRPPTALEPSSEQYWSRIRSRATMSPRMTMNELEGPLAQENPRQRSQSNVDNARNELAREFAVKSRTHAPAVF